MSSSVTETGCQMKPSQVDHEVFEMDCLYQRPEVVVRDSPFIQVVHEVDQFVGLLTVESGGGGQG